MYMQIGSAQGGLYGPNGIFVCPRCGNNDYWVAATMDKDTSRARCGDCGTEVIQRKSGGRR